MHRLGIEQNLSLANAILGHGNNVFVAPALASSSQRPQRAHGACDVVCVQPGASARRYTGLSRKIGSDCERETPRLAWVLGMGEVVSREMVGGGRHKVSQVTTPQ